MNTENLQTWTDAEVLQALNVLYDRPKLNAWERIVLTLLQCEVELRQLKASCQRMHEALDTLRAVKQIQRQQTKLDTPS